MTHTAIAANVRSFKSQPFTSAEVAYRSQLAALRQIAEHERHRLAREVHDGAIQEVLAAGLAIDFVPGRRAPRITAAGEPGTG